jgi:hypothetical protein
LSESGDTLDLSRQVSRGEWKEALMNANTDLRDMDPVKIVRAGQTFLVEYEPSPLATGWQLRERQGDGWPIMAGPYETRDEAIEAVEEFI